MATPSPITRKDDSNRLKREPPLHFVSMSTPAGNDDRFDRLAANDENFNESEREEQFQEETHRLQEAQRRAMIIQEENDISEAEEEFGSAEGSLTMQNEQVRLSSYAAPLMVACFADILDYTIVLALPGIKTVLSFCLTTLIFLLLFFPKRRYKISSNARLAIIDAFILLGLIPLEGLLFPFNLLPFTVAAVGMIYMTDKKFVAARNAKKFDRKSMKTKLSAAIGGAWRDRNAPTTGKSLSRERIRELNA